MANGGWETFLSYEDPEQDIFVVLPFSVQSSPLGDDFLDLTNSKPIINQSIVNQSSFLNYVQISWWAY